MAAGEPSLAPPGTQRPTLRDFVSRARGSAPRDKAACRSLVSNHPSSKKPHAVCGSFSLPKNQWAGLLLRIFAIFATNSQWNCLNLNSAYCNLSSSALLVDSNAIGSASTASFELTSCHSSLVTSDSCSSKSCPSGSSVSKNVSLVL